MLGQISNENNNEINSFKSFGKKIGLAFQITDDILEAISSEEILGKDIQSDLKNCKSTYVSVLGIDESKKESKKLMESAISDLQNIESKDKDLLIELAKYISLREN